MLFSRHQGHAAAQDRGAGTVLDRGWRYDAEVWLFDTFLMRGQIGRLRHNVLERTEVGAGQSLLDVGCGTGTLALQAARLVGANGRVAGIDPAPRQIARARGKARRAGYDVDFRQATIDVLPFADESFDAVTSTLMMHHLPGAVKAPGLGETHRVLKRGGRLVVADFDSEGESEHGQAEAGGGDLPADGLAELIADAGFTRITSSHIDFPRRHRGWSGATIIVATKP